jgi:hypothetical protein
MVVLWRQLVLRYRVIGNNLSLTFGIAFCFNLKFNLYRKSPLQSAQPLPLHQQSTKNRFSHGQGIPKLRSRVPIGQRWRDVVEVWLGSAVLTGWPLNAIGLGPGGQHVLYQQMVWMGAVSCKRSATGQAEMGCCWHSY